LSCQVKEGVRFRNYMQGKKKRRKRQIQLKAKDVRADLSTTKKEKSPRGVIDSKDVNGRTVVRRRGKYFFRKTKGLHGKKGRPRAKESQKANKRTQCSNNRRKNRGGAGNEKKNGTSHLLGMLFQKGQ